MWLSHVVCRHFFCPFFQFYSFFLVYFHGYIICYCTAARAATTGAVVLHDIPYFDQFINVFHFIDALFACWIGLEHRNLCVWILNRHQHKQTNTLSHAHTQTHPI